MRVASGGVAALAGGRVAVSLEPVCDEAARTAAPLNSRATAAAVRIRVRRDLSGVIGALLGDGWWRAWSRRAWSRTSFVPCAPAVARLDLGLMRARPRPGTKVPSHSHGVSRS